MCKLPLASFPSDEIFPLPSGVNNFLTGVLWGCETEDGQWEWISTSPSLQKPLNSPNCITYFKYLENQIVKQAIDRKDLRAKTGSFVFNEGARFRPFYDALIESLRYNQLGTEHRSQEDTLLNRKAAGAKSVEPESPMIIDASQRQSRFSALHLEEVPVNGFRSTSGTLYHYILPAFFRLIEYLQATKRDFVIYLRTMGDDSKNFLLTTEHVLGNEHPSFHFNEPLHVNHEPGRILRANRDKICLQMKFYDDPNVDEISDEFLVNEKLVRGHGVHAVKDDFTAWCQTNYHYTTSKPVWFDPDDRQPQTQHILFDDNFRVIDEHDSIVDIRIIDREKHRCYSCAFEYYPQLENVFAVQANLYSILANENYYIEKVEECERNFDKLLDDPATLQGIKEKSCRD